MNTYTCLVFVFVALVAGANEPRFRWRHMRLDGGYTNELDQKLQGIEERLYRAEDKVKSIFKAREVEFERLKMHSKYAKINTEIVYKMTNQCEKRRNRLRCLESGECIHELLVCDGHVDCADGSDERAHVCDFSLFSTGLLYRGYLLRDQTCFMDARKVYLNFQCEKIRRLPHFPQVAFNTGTLEWEYEWINGSKTYESRDWKSIYMPGSGFEHAWTIEDEPVIFKANISYFTKDMPILSYVYLGDNPISCGRLLWVIPDEFDETVDAVYSNE
ncbi:unnamed protein product [Owenia fusiformis]|uniref:Hemoglobin linker chain n=1 Tax=Owenia fusiformis TaxID=6347 RepID=A0A8S4Q5Y4_OWEFU|nr:unnamed protein product [Owenia fusiformis]